MRKMSKQRCALYFFVLPLLILVAVGATTLDYSDFYWRTYNYHAAYLVETSDDLNAFYEMSIDSLPPYLYLIDGIILW